MKNKLFWQDTADPYPESECISVPIYYNADRDKTVTCFNMPCGGNQSRWTQCGAALFLKSQWCDLDINSIYIFQQCNVFIYRCSLLRNDNLAWRIKQMRLSQCALYFFCVVCLFWIALPFFEVKQLTICGKIGKLFSSSPPVSLSVLSRNGRSVASCSK